jgi:2,4-dienoyl-CoA reductase-like NADH-dependent reductase (Old Yellow Enzyme family)
MVSLTGDYWITIWPEHGGAGLIIISAAVVNEKAKRHRGNLAIYNDIFIDGLANLAKEIKSTGAIVFQQLNHVGRLVKTMTIPDSKYQPVGPSSIPHPLTGEICKELSIDEIKEIVRKFAYASGRVKKAGFDGLELHGAHGYLLNQFLSPYTNLLMKVVWRQWFFKENQMNS